MSNLVVLNVELDPQAADPAAPPDGLVWFNSTDNQYRIRRSGVTYDIADTVYVDDAIQSALNGVAWQDPIISELSTPPVGPSTGDRYIVTPTGLGAWAGQDNSIAEWDGSAWVFAAPAEGWAAFNETTDTYRMFNGLVWGNFGAVVDHGSLTGLGDDDHTQYLLVSGTRAMTGNLNMGTNDITNVGLVDGVDVSNHAARHVSGGVDQIDGDVLDITYVPTNYTRDTTPPEVTTVVELTAHLAGIDTALAGVSATDIKSGSVLAVGFAGNPKQATVAFSTAYPNTNYAVELTGLIGGSNKQYVMSVTSKTVAGFTIQIASNNISNLVGVEWVTKPYLDP